MFYACVILLAMRLKPVFRLKQACFPTWTIPFCLAGLIFISYGLQVDQLGFYWDDWAKTLVHRLFGLNGYWSYYAEDRPYSAWTHLLFIPLLGDSPLNWQILALTLRWLTSVAVWWFLRGLWRDAEWQAGLTAALFSVYPVFTHQAIAVTFHQQWLQYVLCFVSFGAMVQAFRKPGRFWTWTALSVITLISQLLITEYFIGVELVRSMVLWFLLSSQSFREKLRRWFKWYSPYLLISAGYILWRLFLLQLPNEDPYKAQILYDFLQAPLKTLNHLWVIIWKDTIYVLITHWYQTFDVSLFAEKMQPFAAVSWLAAILVALGSAFYFHRLSVDDEFSKSRMNGAGQMMVLGLAAALLGMLPAWVTGRQVIFDAHSNRYAQPALFGASLLSVGFLNWVSQKRLQKSVLFSVLIALAVGFNMRLTNEYRWQWVEQTRFYWQLYWRAPYLQPNTAILNEKEPLTDQGLFSTSAAINLLYPQPPEFQEHGRLAYWLYSFYPRYASGLPENLQFGFHTQFRTLKFEGSSPNTLLIFYDLSKTNCLWVLRPDDAGDPELPTITAEAIRAANPALISAQPVSDDYPPSDLFGLEPEHGWCYFFEKADLARQFEDWNMVVELGDRAKEAGFSPLQTSSNAPHEWRPFIEGYAHVGRWDEARELTLQAAQKGKRYLIWLCQVWKLMGKGMEDNLGWMEQINRTRADMNCEKLGF